ncbi:MAG TPA: aminodeoxychorismate/anthranilate synthase component II [Bacteroidota bacterium]|nr:aminodeoxychorismate/anthranilate synthase component II [Bacteroidota bacterium]
MILIIDNYDSFTYNLVQLVGKQRKDLTVVRNDKMTIDEIKKLHPEYIIISPGPGRPENAGVCVELIKQLGQHFPILGVCLGHQAIGSAFGAKIVHAPSLMHGKTSKVNHDGDPLFEGIPSGFEATRYHSLVISKETVPADLEVTASTADGVIMGVRHKKYPIDGIQFHPESVLTKVGDRLIANWLAYRGAKA